MSLYYSLNLYCSILNLSFILLILKIMGRRQEKKDLTARQILSVAATLFAENGYSNTSVDDIATKANIAKGTFYYHFDSKEAVVVALRTDSFIAAFEKALETLAKGDKAMAILERVLLDRAAWTEENPELAKVFFEQRIHQFLFRDNDPIVRPDGRKNGGNGSKHGQLPSAGGDQGNKKKEGGRLFALVKELIVVGQKNKELRQDLNATELTQIILATFLHAQGSWIGGYSSTSLVDKVHRWFHAILDGLYA